MQTHGRGAPAFAVVEHDDIVAHPFNRIDEESMMALGRLQNRTRVGVDPLEIVAQHQRHSNAAGSVEDFVAGGNMGGMSVQGNFDVLPVTGRYLMDIVEEIAAGCREVRKCRYRGSQQ